ncbi:MAG: GAF domain-containing protein [Candidatus Rokubacteria bacterium]|nr:GAF domain-containing protein [Candidatus Rokubacteria bacterium]
MEEPQAKRSFWEWLTGLFSAPSPADIAAPVEAAAPPAPAAAPVPEPLAAPPVAPPGIPEPSPTTREAAGRREEILRVQAVTASLLTKKVSPGEVFRHIVDGAADCLQADEASLMLVDGDELRVVSARKADEHVTIHFQTRPTKIGEGVAGWVAREGKPLLLNEGDDFSRFTNFAPKGGRIRSALSVPLHVEGRVVGVLNANRLAGGENFTADDLAVLRLFGDTAALAIDQTSLLQTVQTRARAVQTLLAVTDAFSGETEPEGALVKLVPVLGETFHAGWALAFLGSASEGRLNAIAAWTPRGGSRGRDGLSGVGLGLTGEVPAAFQNEELVFLSGLPVEGTLDGSLPSRLLFVPVGDLGAQSRCALILGWDDPGFTPPSEDLKVLEGLARQLALVLSRQDRAAAVGALEAEMAQARAHLMEAERLATIGQSMAGVVHDINAPLTAVTAFAQLLQKESVEPKTRERSGHIIEAAQRAQRLVRELLTMARPHPPSFELIDLHQTIQVAMDLERPQCAVSGIKLTTAFDPNLPKVKADPHRLGQVFINLLVNARQAMDSAGKGTQILVQTRPSERTIEARFADDGPGIPPHVKAKIFDWFFTTKPPGEGTGLGLAVSREILLAHGGNLRVEDTAGGGATFVLEFPMPAPDAPAS